jgi:O-antigen/teichoic acid export membrane protein
MLKKIKPLLATATFRQSVVTTTSIIINGGLGAAFYFLVAKWLGPHEFGLFSLAVTVIGLLISVFDLGSDQGVVKFVSGHSQSKEYFPFAKLALSLKISVGLMFIVLFTFFSVSISQLIFHQSEIAPLLPLVGLGILTNLIFSFSTSLSQALQKYWLWGALFVGTNFFRFIFVVLLFMVGAVSSGSTTLVYILMPLFGFLVSLNFLNFGFWRASVKLSEVKNFFTFNKWVTGFVIVSAISSRLDIFFSARLLDLSQTGVYSLAVQISSILPQLTTAIGAVTAPKFASFTSTNGNSSYVTKASIFTSLTAICSCLVLFPVSLLVITWAGKNYDSSLLPLVILLISMGLFLATAPFRDSITYYFGKPQFFFWISLGQLIIMILGNLLLVPQMHIVGVALVVFISQVYLSLSSAGYFIFLKNHDQDFSKLSGKK